MTLDHVSTPTREEDMNNYGTLSSDYDAGYDDGHADALNEIRNMLSGKEWSPDTLEAISGFVTRAGFEIEEPSPT